MAHLVEFRTDDDAVIVVEVPDDQVGIKRAAIGGDAIAKAAGSLDAAFEKVRTFADTMVIKLRDLKDYPEQVELEFGVRLSAELGAFIASGQTEANVKVTLTWKPSQPSTDEPARHE